MPRLADPYTPSALTFEQEPFCKAPLATYAPTAPLASYPANLYQARNGAPAPAQALLQKEIKLSARPLGKPFDEMSDSDASTSSSPLYGRRRCLCGKEVVQDGGIYCSSACARTDAFSSLCYKPTSVAAPQPHPSLGTSLDSSSFMRHHASTSTATSQSAYSERDTLCSTASSSSSDWSASHYRRLARQDLRREERREERRRRRAEGSVASTSTASSSLRATHMSSSSTSSSRVPDLIGGHLGLGHSRTHSTASTASSAWSGSQLSRNPSMASVSSLSSRRGPGSSAAPGGGFGLDGTIMEADDEEEMLVPALNGGVAESRTYPVPRKAGAHKRRLSHSLRGIGSDEKSPLGAAVSEIGMGRDMRDVLEEILQMEKMFMVDEEESPVVDLPHRLDPTDLPAYRPPVTGLPPKTPPPRAADKDRMSGIVQAPMAPSRGHKHSLSNANISPVMGGARGVGARPPSFIGGHQSSLSESHTALYLATASPTQDSPLRRSASPTLEARRSLHFDANSAGPSIAALQAAAAAGPGGSGGPSAVARFESPISANVTPRRRRINFSPAHHPTIDHWRFPSATTSTPTRPHHLPPINTNLAPVIAPAGQPAQASLPVPQGSISGTVPTSLRSIASAARPTRQNSGSSTTSCGASTTAPAPMQTTPTPATSSAASADARIPQHLLWPPPPNLAPSLFPTSPNDTPDYRPAGRGAHGARLSPTGAASPQVFVPPNSGLRLGVLLGSGEDDGMGMDLDDDAASAHSHGSSTLHGHSHGHGQSGFARLGQSATGQNTMAGRGGFPVFLEAEGFRPSVRQRW